jgi:hypothetical protein
VNYGTNKDELLDYIIVEENTAIITGLDLVSYVNYVQIFPLNINDVID